MRRFYLHKRGILTAQEAGELFATPWKEEQVHIATHLSVTCGLRLVHI